MFSETHLQQLRWRLRCQQ